MRGRAIMGLGGNFIGERTSVIAYQIFSEEFQNIWKEWNLRIAVIISLIFQIILIFFASVRKRSGNTIIQAVIWSSYLLADWIAAFAVGLISNSLGENDCKKAAVDDALAAFWAPFLLLHLGGPDTITAFSLEDNELWIRHLLSVTVQVVAVGYVFIQALPNRQFWIPTVLVFSAGTVKYAERTRALYLACLSNLKDSMRPKPDPGPNYAQFMEEYSANEAASVPKEIYRVQEPETSATRVSVLSSSSSSVSKKRNINEKEIIQRAYWFYKIFRGLIVDHMFSFHERNESRNYFFSLKHGDAFKIIEAELNFMYDALYTKMEAVHHGFFGYVLRFICSALLVAAFVLFSSSPHKHGVHPFDLAATYCLLSGAVILDFVSLIKLIFSDWTVALIEHSSALSVLPIRPLLTHLKVTSGTLAVKRIISFRKRWCERLYQYNLIRYSLSRRYALVDKTADLFALKEFFDRFWYKTQVKMDDSFKNFIFDFLQEKASAAKETKIAKSIYSSRGECTLVDYDCPESVELSVSEDVEYDESVLMWHIATDICYHCFDPSDIKDDVNRTRSKLLSDYLLYLLIMQPRLMLSVAGIANIRFQDTCEEARKFFLRSRSHLNHREACQKLLNVDTSVKPVEVKGDRSKSLLFDAVMLAKDLKQMVARQPEEAWEMTSKVWLEMLCYGASHCRGDAHAQQLRQGGELITFVWLLMAHFGLGEQFRIEAGHARAKLIVEK